MRLHSLTNSDGQTHRKKRVGRGRASGQGKTSGRGHKGQMARKGATHRPGFEGGQMQLIRRVPKRGFNNFTRVEYIPVNVSSLDRFDNGTEVTAEVLKAAGLASGNASGIKILGKGELSKKLNVKVAAFSESAKSKIEAAGGSCEIVRG